MIEEIQLRDLGVIQDATLPLGPGFTAITGETGAGKTMVVTGLNLLLGDRADAGVVRQGADRADVSGVWTIAADSAVADQVRDAGGEVEPVPGDDRAELYLARTISSAGRSRASVGGRTVPASVLAGLAQALVVVHGQSEQARLRSTAAQRQALDQHGGEPLAGLKRAFTEAFDTWRGMEKEFAHLRDTAANRKTAAAQLRLAVAEIEAVNPQSGEDVVLAERLARLVSAEDLRVAASSAREMLSSDTDQTDAVSLIAQVRRELERSSDPALVKLGLDAQELGIRAAELSGDLSSYLAELDEFGPQELAVLQERQAALAGLARSYGSLAQAQELWQNSDEQLAEYEDNDARVELLATALDEAAAAAEQAAVALSQRRKLVAAELAGLVTEELQNLALPDARFEVQINPAELGANGMDDVEFLLAPHPGAQLRPVAKSASGGELSRVMLALEVVISASNPVPTFVFDEVDAGIGGAAAIEVGRRLARLAQSAQVIVVTHLAQVAAFATNHLTVHKASDGQVTASSVRVLGGSDREAEMARLLSGMADSDTARAHAQELLAMAAQAGSLESGQ